MQYCKVAPNLRLTETLSQMSTPRSAKCLFCTFSRSGRRSFNSPRPFHSSSEQFSAAPRGNRRKARRWTRSELRPKMFRPYTEKEKAKLAEKYTPAQRAVIDVGEEAVTNKHLAYQASARQNHWSLKYYDDLSKIDPVVDHPVRAPYSNTDPNLRLKTEDEFDDDLANFIRNLPENEDSPEADEAWTEFDKKLRLTVGREEGERNPRSAAAPDLFRPGEANLDGKILKLPSTKRKGRTEEATPALLRLMQLTGFTREQINALRVKSIVDHRVVNQTRLGKIGKMYYLSVAGNGNGLLGIGEGKSGEPVEARLQSQYRAIRNMQPILRYEGRTIFGDVKGKVSATELELYARPPGFGLRCQQYIWEICKCAGIADLAARVTRSRNPMNTVKATVEALLSQKDPEEIARARGKKIVDVRKVYYAGLV